MTAPRFLFDECFGREAVYKFAGFVDLLDRDEKPHVCHLFDEFDAGTIDREWIPPAAAAGWVVVTRDRGRKGGARRGGKLPRLCVEHGATHVILSRRIGQRKNFEQFLAILSVWPALIQAVLDEPRGTRLVIEPRRGSEVAGMLLKRTVARPAVDMTPPEGHLF